MQTSPCPLRGGGQGSGAGEEAGDDERPPKEVGAHGEQQQQEETPAPPRGEDHRIAEENARKQIPVGQTMEDFPPC